MFDEIKKKAQQVTQAVADKTKAAAQATVEVSKSMASATSAGVSSSLDAQIERVLNIMERTALRAAKRDTISNFQVSANLTLGLAEIGLTVEYDVEALRAKEISDIELDPVAALAEENGAPTNNADGCISETDKVFWRVYRRLSL